MNLQPRIIVGLVLILGVVGLLVYLTSDAREEFKPDEGQKDWGVPPTEGFGVMELTDSKQCEQCHPAIYAEWKQSHHEFAWRNPEPRRKELSDNFKNKDCISCHAPRPMIEVGLGARALERESNRDDGVNCFTCHSYRNVMATGNTLSSAAAGAPCNPVTWAPFREMALCEPCHDQHKVHQNWLQSRFAVPGEEYQDCNDCHMPEMPGPPTVGSDRTTHKSHIFGGGNHPETIRKAGTLRMTVLAEGETIKEAIRRLGGRDWNGEGADDRAEKGERLVLIEAKNTGAGHNFPEDERHRAVDMVARFRPEGRAFGERIRLTRFRNPYRQEFEIKNPFRERGSNKLSDERTWDGLTFELEQLRVLPEYRPDRKVYYPKSTQLMAGESRFAWFALPFAEKGTLEVKLLYKKTPVLHDDDAVVAAEETLDV